MSATRGRSCNRYERGIRRSKRRSKNGLRNNVMRGTKEKETSLKIPRRRKHLQRANVRADGKNRNVLGKNKDAAQTQL